MTGVQTCALPIYVRLDRREPGERRTSDGVLAVSLKLQRHGLVLADEITETRLGESLSNKLISKGLPRAWTKQRLTTAILSSGVMIHSSFFGACANESAKPFK